MSETEAEKRQENDDQSMEEILQSIRRIITEDDADSGEAEKNVEEEKTPIEAPAKANTANGKSKPAATIVEDDEDDSDILELTEIVEDGDDVEEVESVDEEIEMQSEDEDITEEDITEAVEAEISADDVLSEIDTVLGSSEDEDGDNEVESLEIDSSFDESFMSEDTAAEASAMLKNIKKSAKTQQFSSSMPAMRSGVTVEDLMIEAMRPMLKKWLDANLPSVVARVVQKEVKKLVD